MKHSTSFQFAFSLLWLGFVLLGTTTTKAFQPSELSPYSLWKRTSSRINANSVQNGRLSNHVSRLLQSTTVQKQKKRSTMLYGAFSKKNNQSELKKQLELAKQQRLQNTQEESELNSDEIKELNDRKRFDELLNRESVTIFHDDDIDIERSDTMYRTVEQEEEEMNAGYNRIDRIYEGDEAKVESFFDLVSIKNDLALNEKSVKSLLPWLRDTDDYLVVLSDPRMKSNELRLVMKRISANTNTDLVVLEKKMTERIIIVNADTPSENRKWLKKQNINNLKIFSDEKRQWMREYTALGQDRWSICLFVLANGRVQRLVRELDSDLAINSIYNVIKSL